MSIGFEKLLQHLQKKQISPQEFFHYLFFCQKTPFLEISNSLKHSQISLKKYLLYLENSYPNPEKETKSLEIQQIEKVGQILLATHKVSLFKLNALLKTLPSIQLKTFAQKLFQERWISVEDFLSFLKDDFSPCSSSHYLFRKEPTLEFYVEIQNAEKKYGSYIVLEELGRGGMGVVYKAYHPHLNRFVALKVLLKNATNEKNKARFQREIEILAQLEHPGIVQIYDSGIENEEFYFVMEYLEDHSLSKEASTPWTIREKATFIQQVLCILSYAHQKKIIHRDIKLENILVTPERKPILLDFGLAKLNTDQKEDQKLTQSGILIGTAPYIAPEQVEGKNFQIGEQTDIYAIGVCLYYLLTQHFPFQGKNLQHLLQNILRKEPTSPTNYLSNLHYDLETILLKSLEKDQKRRYASAQHFAEDLDSFLQGIPIELGIQGVWSRIRKQYKKHQKLAFWSQIFLGIFFLMFLFLYFMSSKEKAQQIANILQEIHQKEQNNLQNLSEKINSELKSWNILNQALRLFPKNKQFEKKKWEIGSILLQHAFFLKEYQLGDYVLQEMQQLSFLSLEEIQKKQTLWEQQKKIQWNKEEKRFQFWITKFQHGTFLPLQESDALYEIAKMSSPSIDFKLLEIFKQGNLFFYETILTPYEKSNYYCWIVKLLTRRKAQKGLPLLIEALDKISNTLSQQSFEEQETKKFDYLVILAKYLLALEAYTYIHFFENIRWKLGQNGLYWNRTRKIFKKLQKKNFSSQNILSPQTSKEYSQRANQKYDIGDFDGAISDYTEALRLNPQNAEDYNNRGNARQMKGDFDRAIADYTETLRLHPQYLEAYENRGIAKINKGNFLEAIEDLNEVLRIAPQSFKSYNYRGNAKQERGDLEGAILDYTEAIRINPQLLGAYLSRGNAKYARKEFESAALDYNTVIRLDPQNFDGYINRGNILILQGDFDGAIRDCSEAILLEPQSINAYSTRGNAKTQKGDLNGAIHDYSAALQLKPNDSNTYANRAYIKMLQGDWPGAIEDYDNATKYNPNDAQAYFNKGGIYLQLNQRNKAKENFLRFLQLTKPSDVENKERQNYIFQQFPELKTK